MPGGNPLKTGPRTPPGVQTHQFFALGAAVATRGPPEGQEASNVDPQVSKFEPRRGTFPTPPRVQTHQFSELRPAVATRGPPEGQLSLSQLGLP